MVYFYKVAMFLPDSDIIGIQIQKVRLGSGICCTCVEAQNEFGVLRMYTDFQGARHYSLRAVTKK